MAETSFLATLMNTSVRCYIERLTDVNRAVAFIYEIDTLVLGIYRKCQIRIPVVCAGVRYRGCPNSAGKRTEDVHV